MMFYFRSFIILMYKVVTTLCYSNDITNGYLFQGVRRAMKVWCMKHFLGKKFSLFFCKLKPTIYGYFKNYDLSRSNIRQRFEAKAPSTGIFILFCFEYFVLDFCHIFIVIVFFVCGYFVLDFFVCRKFCPGFFF